MRVLDQGHLGLVAPVAERAAAKVLGLRSVLGFRSVFKRVSVFRTVGRNVPGKLATPKHRTRLLDS